MASVTADLKARERAGEFRALLNKKYRYIDRKWDVMFWVTAAFVVGAAVYTTVCLWLAVEIGRWLQWRYFVYYPINFVWPASAVLAGVWLDCFLLKSKSWIITSVIGAMGWTLIFWATNYIMLAPFLQPVTFMGHTLTLADVQGVEYLRTQTPEYLRLVEQGSLRTFLGETLYVALAFGATVTIAGYWIGQFIGRMLAIWPIGKFIKKV